jgi:hypothetical protein
VIAALTLRLGIMKFNFASFLIGLTAGLIYIQFQSFGSLYDLEPENFIALGADKTDERKNEKRKGTNHAALCCIVVDEEAYIDEWVDYHHALGFDSIYVYDNSDNFDMKQWGKEKGNHVTMTHFPGIAQQRPAYLDCAKRLQQGGDHTWAAFFDVDEFLLLKMHEHVEDFLLETLASGQLSINWQMFGTSDKITYSPAPMTKRFMYRQKEVHERIKSIVRLRDMDFSQVPHSHWVYLVNVTDQKDTAGKYFQGAFNPHGPTDVAVLAHYHWKSHKEHLAKRMRGRSDFDRNRGEYQVLLEQAKNLYKAAINGKKPLKNENQFFDDSAWKAMKKYVPKYAVFDEGLS